MSSSGLYVNNRPATIAELAARAQDNLWDPNLPLKHWLRAAEKARRTAEAYVNGGDYERGFIEFAKAATIVLEKLPTHREYHALLNSDQRQNLGMNGQDILDSLSQLKPVLVERYERWQAQNGDSPNGSRPSTSDLTQADPARSRRDAQEQERAQQALEAARREQDWRRDDYTRRQAEERERHVREEAVWVHQSIESRRREEAATAADARRTNEGRVPTERGGQGDRARRDEETREEERAKRRVEEKRKQEQDGIIRRQREAEAEALAARMDIATRLSPSPAVGSSSQQVAAPQPSRPPSSQRQPPNGNGTGLSIMPLESPIRYEDDSSTDVEGAERQMPWHRRHADQTPTKPKHLGPNASYPPPITTTSPAPPDLGPIRYPSLMSQHQLRQGYVPSLQSMFLKPNGDVRATDTSLLFDSKPSSNLYTNILPAPSTPSPPVIPPYPSHMPVPDNRQGPVTYPQTGRRGPSPSGSRYPPTLQGKEPAHSVQQSVVPAPRIVQSTSADSSVRELRTIKLPRECLPRFLSIARINTQRNRETCGLLLGKDKGSKYVVTTLLIPRQRSTSDTCTMDEEELVLQFTEERHLITLGWVSFMSSVDLHTHSGFQRMLPESFAVVCAPTSTPTFGIFRLTDPGGLQTILECTAKEAFHPHPEVPIYTDCDNSHVQMKDISLEIVDLR
ncbi:hypothetical protein B0H21DRAFT_736658 [Amylocystis lapponica]|nr:hypothetical protein B0H21DRAFT_736658 [Amylocystis lapponica]